MSSTRSFVHGAGWLLGLRAANLLLPLVSAPILVSRLGLSGYGVLALGQSLATYVTLLSDFGFAITATRRVAEHRDDNSELLAIYAHVQAAKFLLYGTSILVAVPLTLLVPAFDPHGRVYALFCLAAIAQVLEPTWYFRGIEQTHVVAILSIVGRIVSLMMVILLIWGGEDLIILPFALASGAILSSVCQNLIVLRSLRAERLRWSVKTLRSLLKESRGYFVARVAAQIYTASNVLVLGLSGAPPELVGSYGIAERIFVAAKGMYIPIADALYPNMVARRDRLCFFLRVLRVAVAANIGVVVLSVLSLSTLVPLVFDGSTMNTVRYSQSLLAICAVILPSLLIGYPLIGVAGRPAVVNRTTLIASVFHLSIVIGGLILGVVSPWYLIVVTVCSELIVFSLRVWHVHRTGLLA